MDKYTANNIAIWSHWPAMPPDSYPAVGKRAQLTQVSNHMNDHFVENYIKYCAGLQRYFTFVDH